ncbi:Transposase InsO and inactivated derivatives [Anaerosphaera aminiphila DSM 21120]|uniref:Transposase InsO and inactivated derivatives n=1 Tax=Anaerosphaera aminiphila DSM 21120 TaxID=1120995 RepID=A0A1M5PV44_9FIRM|nr:IS3 family transposase [Anaerosphaera aminiphila]SHH05674.1 Transposase InsO and inactivated derivatives [Anaerosphaera aminiphila DSM 21120]
MVVNSLRHNYDLKLLFEIIDIKRSTFYYHLSKIDIPDKYLYVKDKIVEIFNYNKGRYGYRRITLELKNLGILINHKTVQRLMKELGIVCKVRIKKYKSYKGMVGKIADNLINRNFTASKPNEKWVTDVTEISMFGEKLYLSPILDLYNGEIISYSINNRPCFEQVMEMLDIAFKKHKDLEGLIFHSDQGWQYQHRTYQSRLKGRGIKQSMSRKGNCLDNAVMENFFGLFKSELLYLQEFESMEHFKKELKGYIKWYNEKRIKSKLKGMSPIKFRTQSSVA